MFTLCCAAWPYSNLSTWQNVAGLIRGRACDCVCDAVVWCAAQCMTYAGTVTYMSPERLENKPYNFSADIW
jgi:serine/threonine protein kinase